MIVVDTSVWVSFFRSAESPVRRRLEALLDEDAVLLPAPVKIELLSGSGAGHHRVLQRTLGALRLLVPSVDTWALVERWAVQGSAKGRRFGVADLLVAACAAERGARLWTLDDDFDGMVALRWVRRFTE